jgi:pilus assembly protein CpaB
MKPARIIVLVIAIGAGGIAAWLASGSDPVTVVAPAPPPVVQLETVDVLVAGADIGLGSIITARDLRWQLWPAAGTSAQFVRRTDRPDAIEQLAGSITRQSFAAGEPIREARLIRAQGSGYLAAILPQGMRAIALEVSPESGAGGFILPNDHVDIIVTRRERVRGVDVPSSSTVLTNLRVLAIDQTVEEKGGQRVVVGRTATIQVTPVEAETLARSKAMGQLALVLRSVTDFEAREPREEARENVVIDDTQETQQGVNIVRFGITSITTAK